MLSTTVISDLFATYGRDTLIENTNEIAANLAKNSAYALIFKSRPRAEKAVSDVASLSNTSYVALYTTDGTLLFDTGRLPATEKLKILPPAKTQQIVKKSSNQFHMLVPVFVNNEEYRSATLGADRSGRTVGSDAERIGTVYLVTSKSSIIRAKRKVQNGLWAISATAGVLSLLLILIITKRLTTPLSQLTLAMSEAGRTMNFNDVPVRGSAEVRHITETYNRLTHELMAEKESLESRVNERTMELSKANETNRALIKKMNSLLEQERRYLAGEIHDELNGVLVAIRLKLEYTKNRLSPLTPSVRERITDNISEAMQLVNDGYDVARRIRHRLRPEAIEITTGLGKSLWWTSVPPQLHGFSGLPPEDCFAVLLEGIAPKKGRD